MNKLDKSLVEDLLLTMAMEKVVGKYGIDSFDDAMERVFEDGTLNREKYHISVMKLTQLGYVDSEIESEEDIEIAETLGLDINGLTEEGRAYIEKLKRDETIGGKIINAIKEIDNICGKIADSGIVKLTGTILLPAISMV